jgi:hypothetical protein
MAGPNTRLDVPAHMTAAARHVLVARTTVAHVVAFSPTSAYNVAVQTHVARNHGFLHKEPKKHFKHSSYFKRHLYCTMFN